MLSEKTNTFYGGIKYGSCDHYDRKLCAREVASTLAAGPEGPRTRCSDETLTLPDLVGWDDVDNDR